MRKLSDTFSCKTDTLFLTRTRPEEIISGVPDLTSSTQDSSTATTAVSTPLNPFNVTPESTQAAISQKRKKESRRRSNSISWCTLFHVILSLRTWHSMISILQHARNEHCSARCGFQTSVKHVRLSSFCFWEYRVRLYSMCFKGEFQSYFEGFYMCFTDLSRTTCALSCNYKLEVWDPATNKVHCEEPKPWLI